VDAELQFRADGLVEFLEDILVLGDCHKRRRVASEAVNGFFTLAMRLVWSR
jgi:hypothetical protein